MGKMCQLIEIVQKELSRSKAFFSNLRLSQVSASHFNDFKIQSFSSEIFKLAFLRPNESTNFRT